MTKDQSMSIDRHLPEVAEYFNISQFDIKGKKRTKSVVHLTDRDVYRPYDNRFLHTEIGYNSGVETLTRSCIRTSG